MFFDGDMKNPELKGTLVEKTEKKLAMNEIHMSRKRQTTQSDSKLGN